MENIWSKLEKPNKTEQDKKSLICIYAYFFTAANKL